MLFTKSYISVVVLLSEVLIAIYAKSSCEICNDIVRNFKSGLEKTVKSNFGGGNTNWEEKSLGKWKTSETRLVEIVDHHICEGNEKECHMFVERNEEALEDWYFNKYKDLDSADSLQEHLCVTSAEACCTSGRYGKKCTDCPTQDGRICGGNGKCKGDGTRSGDGTCECDSGYSGALCDTCEDEYYEQLTGSVKVCLECDASCEDTCDGPGPKACDDCTDGYTWQDNSGCEDDDECADNSNPCLSKEKTYCVNTQGSFLCEPCHKTCGSCFGKEASDCTECSPGYEKLTPESHKSVCTDVDECSATPDICSMISGAQCYNTEGSHECKCSDENQEIKGDQCINITEQVVEEQKPEDTNIPAEEAVKSIEPSGKDEL